MLRTIMIVAAAAGLLAVGAMSALAGNSHAKAASTLATSTTLKGDAVSAIARATGELKSEAARLNADAALAATQTPSQAQAQTQAQAETDSDTTDESTDGDDNETTDDAAPAAPAAAPATNSEQKGAEHDD